MKALKKLGNGGFSYQGMEYYPVPLAQLRVDEEYQRQLSKKAIKQNSGDLYEPLAQRPLTVSLRKDGFFYVMDGNHRWRLLVLAAAAGSGDTHAVCQVHAGLKPEKEARLFNLLNRTHTVAASDKFRADVAGKDETALKILHVVLQHGFEINKMGRGRPTHDSEANVLKGVKTLQRIVKIMGEQILENTLVVIKKAYRIPGSQTKIDMGACRDGFVAGLAKFLFDVKPDVNEVVRCLKGTDASAIMKEVTGESGQSRKDNAKYLAEHFAKMMSPRKKAA